jgi:hypothetical protein
VKPILIADIGSLWGDSLDTALEAARAVALAGFRPKFQFCQPTNGNRPLPAEYLPEIVKACPNASASVWDINGLEAVIKADAAWVKLAWSAPRSLLSVCKDRLPVVLTMHDDEFYSRQQGLWRLLTAEDGGVPIYPDRGHYPKQVHVDSYGDPLYPDAADGFSCHGTVEDCLDAVKAGAQILEVHTNPLALPEDWAPDARFALSLSDLERLGKAV